MNIESTLSASNFRRKYATIFDENITSLLQESDYEKLVILLESDEFRTNFGGVTEYAYLILAAQIYKAETQNNIATTIFSNRKKICSILSCLEQLKFMLWRIYYAKDLAAVPVFYDYIRSEKISDYCLLLMLQICGIDALSFMQMIHSN